MSKKNTKMKNVSSSPPHTTLQNTNTLIKDSTDQRFTKDVLEASYSVLVLVDFHASWCAPCRQLRPILEKQVRAAKGRVQLVKMDIDRNKLVATQLRISSIPAVYAFYQGTPIDGFMGVLSESQIQRFLDRLLQKIGNQLDKTPDSLLSQAKSAVEQNDLERAAHIFDEVLRLEPQNESAYCGLVRCNITAGTLQQAQLLLETVPQALKDSQQIIALKNLLQTIVHLTQAAQNIPPISSLQNTVTQNPNDLQARYDLAIAYYIQGNREQAVDTLLEIVIRDQTWQDQKARKLLLTLFEIFGPTTPLTVKSRRRLSAALFR